MTAIHIPICDMRHSSTVSNVLRFIQPKPKLVTTEIHLAATLRYYANQSAIHIKKCTEGYSTDISTLALDYKLTTPRHLTRGHHCPKGRGPNRQNLFRISGGR